MTFLYPAFGWAFFALGVILLLYLLKRRYEETPVPSTFLWQQTQRDTTANRPFQRLKRSLLLLLHLLMAAVLALVLMQPVLPGSVAGETVMIFDLSASMGATNGHQTRLEAAASAAMDILAGMGDDDPLTILTADSGTHQLLSRSTDRDAARRLLASLQSSASGADLSAAVSLAQAMQREADGLQIIVFSDSFTPPEGISAHNAAAGVDNRTVASFTVENGKGYARIMNYGAEADLTLTCYADGTLCDARSLHLPEGASAGIAFTVPSCAFARVEIQEADGLAADNGMTFVPAAKPSTVALCGSTSVFLDYGLSLRENLRLLKTDTPETLSADVYVYAENGALFFSKSPSQQKIAAGEAFTPVGSMRLADEHPVTCGLSLKDVAARSCVALEGGKALVTLNERCVLAADEGVVVLGFSLNNTNLPMKYDFPILMQNILDLLLPENTPLDAPMEDAIPLSESDVRLVAPSVDAAGSADVLSGGTRLAPWLLGLFLVLIFVEWVVSRRGI